MKQDSKKVGSYSIVKRDSEGNFFSVNLIRGFGVSNCNRDESGSPKTATFGGTSRARHASASIKRPMRLSLNENPRVGKYFRGVRTMLVEEQLHERLINLGMAIPTVEACIQEFSEIFRGGKTKETKAAKAAKSAKKTATTVEVVADGAVGSATEEAKDDADEKKRALFFISEGELDMIAKYLFEREQGEKKPLTKSNLIDIIKEHNLEDALDIRFFGRMAASIPEISEEGRAYAAHSISTNKQSNEINFFTAMDDLSDGKSGSAHMDNEEFNCPVMYEHISFDLNGIFEGYDHLTIEIKREIIAETIKAFIDSIPIGKKHGMFSDTPASYASVIMWKSQPFTLVNAFEKAITDKGDGIIAPSIEALKAHWEKVKLSYADHLSANQIAEFTLGECSINDFANKVANELIK